MPLYLRRIEPINLGSKHVGFTEASTFDENTLVQTKEECANRILCNLMRQIASLGKLANDIFVSIEQEAQVLQQRSKSLTERAGKIEENIQVRIYFVIN